MLIDYLATGSYKTLAYGRGKMNRSELEAFLLRLNAKLDFSTRSLRQLSYI